MDPPISWTIHRETVLLLGWGRAILMQFAHPLVASGVAEHSAFRAEAFGGWRRLHRTLGAMLALTFGERDDAQQAADRINAIHERVHGRLPDAAGPFAAGTRYSACDPALLAWVHATLVDSFLLAYGLYVRPLSAAERDAYCAESAGIESLLRIPPGTLPRTAAALASYVADRLASGEIHVTDTARALARGVLHPPMSAPAWPALAVMRLATIGLLPPALRDAYGFPWNTRRAAALRVSMMAIRSVLPIVPPVLRHWPAARAAMRRATTGQHHPVAPGRAP
ncbi:MAG TPA: oxygenase MpaB family protein [Candidatus Acidoferrum sp.]|nr:oxygenase MpaB family protein [Candidatus Acidoferrum sp.]